jgi:hypothetical protein
MRVETIIRGLPPLAIACGKREAFAQGSAATKQSILSFRGEMDCFASLAMTNAHVGVEQQP